MRERNLERQSPNVVGAVTQHGSEHARGRGQLLILKAVDAGSLANGNEFELAAVSGCKVVEERGVGAVGK